MSGRIESGLRGDQGTDQSGGDQGDIEFGRRAVLACRPLRRLDFICMAQVDQKLSTRYIAGVIRVRWLVIGVWLAMMAAAASVYLAKFRIDNSVAIWFLEDDPELASYRQSLEAFGEREWTYLWLRTPSVFAPDFLRDLQDLAASIEELDHVHRTVAITGARGTERDASGRQQAIDYYTVSRGTLPDASQVDAFREGLRRSPLYSEPLLAGDAENFTIVAIQNDNLIRELEPYRIGLIDQVRELVARYPTVRDSGLVGTTVVNAELNRAAKRDMLVYYALIATFVFCVGGIVLRHRRDLLVLVAVLLGTVMPVMGGAAAYGLSFNLMTVMLPTLLVTVGVSYLIHFLNAFHHERLSSREVARALTRTFQRLLKPGFWTSATTVVGFVSLTFSGVVPIRQVGWLAAAGIVLAWLTTLTVTPALLSIIWPDGESHRPPVKRRNRTGFLLLQVIRPRPLLVCGFALAVVAAVVALPRLEADTNYVKFFKPGNAVRADYEQLRGLGLPQSSLDITIKFPEGARFADFDRHRQLVSFEAVLRALPEVKRVESLSRLVRLMAQDFAGGAADDKGRLGVLLVLAESGILPEAEEFIARDGNTIRLRVMTDYMSTDALADFRAKLGDVIGTALPDDLHAALTGTNLLWANMDAQVVRTQLLSIGITSAAVIVILPFVFRSLVLGMLGFLVSFVPIVCTLGIMAWVGLPVNIATCILGGVVIGLSVDDTIYFGSRVREALDRGRSIGTAVRHSVWTTGRAMVKTSAVLIGGFLTMAASDFLPSVYFGLFFAASIVIALLADLVLLPALLRRCARIL